MNRSFLGHTAIYGLATFLMQAAGFVLLPLYLRCLSKEQVGVLEVVTRFAETAATLLLFGGFRQALFALYGQAEGEDKRRVVSSAYLLVSVCAVVGALVAWFLPRWGNIEVTTMRLALLTVVIEPFSVLPLVLMQARTWSLAYVGVVAGQFLLRVVLAVVFVASFGWGINGVLLAIVVTSLVFGTVLTLCELRLGFPQPTWPHLRALLAFALPLLPGGLCFFVLHHGDRFFLLRYAGEEAVGVYGLGYKIGMLVTTFGLGPVYMVWSARMYAVAKQPDAAQQFGDVIARIMAWFLLLGLGLCLFASDLIQFIGGPAYASAAWIVPAVVLACGFQALATLMDGGLYVTRRTDRKLVASGVSAGVMLALYSLLIPPYGPMGAALATLLGFACLAGLTYRLSQPLFPVRYQWGRMSAVLLIVCGIWGLSLIATSFLARCGLLVLAPVLFSVLLKREEWSLIVSRLRQPAPSPSIAA